MAEKSNARVKGGKVAAAIRKAKETGEDQALPEYSIKVTPTGEQLPLQNITEPPAAAGLPETGPINDGIPGGGAATIPAPEMDPIDMGDPIPAQATIADQVRELIALGVSPADAAALVRSSNNGQATGPATPAAVVQVQDRQAEMDRAVQGPDPALVAAYHAKMADYVPPAREAVFSVTMPVRFADYVRRWAIWESASRGREVTPEDAIQMMVRKFWQTDERRAMLTSGSGSGPADAFDPIKGQYTS